MTAQWIGRVCRAVAWLAILWVGARLVAMLAGLP